MSSELRELWINAGGRVPHDWNIVSLESLFQDAKSITVGVMYPGTHTVGGIPLIKVGDIKGGCIPIQPDFCLSAETNHEYRRSQLVGNELLITLVGNPGECVVVTPQMAGWNPARAVAVMKLKDVGLRTYVKTVLESAAGKHLIDSVLNTTVQKTLNLKDIRRLPIPMPLGLTINNISTLSEAFSDRIALLRETNQTLEAIAQALFKSWFVNFDPVRAKANGKLPDGINSATAELFPDAFEETELGMVPNGWRVGNVESICDSITNGGTPSRSNKEYWTDGKIPWFKTGELSDCFLLDPSERITQLAIASTSVKILPPNAVLMAIYAAPTVGRLGILTESAAFNQACTGMVAKQVIGSWFLYWTLYLGRDWFNSRANGAAQQNISKVIVSNYKLVIPDERVLGAFNIICDALHSKIRTNSQQVQTLSNLRDTLMPRLISGQLRIADAEAELEKAIA
jgi:type I restriction enzyme S subunit